MGLIDNLQKFLITEQRQQIQKKKRRGKRLWLIMGRPVFSFWAL